MFNIENDMPEITERKDKGLKVMSLEFDNFSYVMCHRGLYHGF